MISSVTDEGLKITAWTATLEVLEIKLWIETWSMQKRYRRMRVTQSSGNYAKVWKWIEGGADSGQLSWASEAAGACIDNLVISDPVLNLFCSHYGIAACD